MSLIKRQVFYSFHYKNDVWRVAKIRNIGVIEGNRPAPDNDWETIKYGGDTAIERWIAEQMKGRSCMVLLIGSETANRKWINHEIIKAWNNGMGIVGIYIHNIKDHNQRTSFKGSNPLDHVVHKGVKLSNIFKVYDSPYNDSAFTYGYIADNIQRWTNEAVEIRNRY